jgi:hypothetical protein
VTAPQLRVDDAPNPRRLGIISIKEFRPSGDLVRLLGLWAAWLSVLCVFQIVVGARLQPLRPDAALNWTSGATGDPVTACNGQPNAFKPRLADPNMNEHVAYDSEYYVSIAASGYDDPSVQALYPDDPRHSGVPVCDGTVDYLSLNYAFMPGYPMAMRPVMAVASVVPFASDLTETGKATLAGIVVSALGGMLAMLALARLMAFLDRRRKTASEAGSEPTSAWGGTSGLRAALYLLVFPTGFYLAQVYSEGLFIGLAFMACAMAVERKVLAGAGFALLAALVRPVGVFLFFPLAWAAFETMRESWAEPRTWRTFVPAVAAFAPVLAFGAWYGSTLGEKWREVESAFFSRSFDLPRSIDMWQKTVASLLSGVDKTAPDGGYGVFTQGGGTLAPASMVYGTLEVLALGLAVIASVWLFRKMPGVALFGIGVLVLSAGSSAAQGMDRYVLAVPAIFLMLAWFGRRVVFDRVWVMVSTLLMGMLAMLFTFGFWVS